MSTGSQTGLSEEARAALAISIPVAFFLLASLLLVFWYVHRNTSGKGQGHLRRPPTRNPRRDVYKTAYDTWSSSSSISDAQLEKGDFPHAYGPKRAQSRTVPRPARPRPNKVAVPPPLRTRNSPVPFSREYINYGGPLTPIDGLPTHPALRSKNRAGNALMQSRSRPHSGRPDSSPRLVPFLPRSRYQPPQPPSPSDTIETSRTPEEVEVMIERQLTRPSTPEPIAAQPPVSRFLNTIAEASPTRPLQSSPTRAHPIERHSQENLAVEVIEDAGPSSTLESGGIIRSRLPRPPTSTPKSTTPKSKSSTPPSRGRSMKERQREVQAEKTNPFLAVPTTSTAPAVGPLTATATTITKPAKIAKQKLTDLASKLRITTQAPAPPPSPTNSSPNTVPASATSPLRSPPGLMSWDRIALQNAQRRAMMGPSPSPVSPLTIPANKHRGATAARRGATPASHLSISDDGSGTTTRAAVAASAAEATEANMGTEPLAGRRSITPVSFSSQGSVRTPMRLGSPVLATVAEGGPVSPMTLQSQPQESYSSQISQPSQLSPQMHQQQQQRGHEHSQSSAGAQSGGGSVAGGRPPGHHSSAGGMSGGSGTSAARREVRRSRDVDYEG